MKTVWCDECGGPSDVVDEGLQPDGPEPWAPEFWVRMLDCGHDQTGSINPDL